MFIVHGLQVLVESLMIGLLIFELYQYDLNIIMLVVHGWQDLVEILAWLDCQSLNFTDTQSFSLTNVKLKMFMLKLVPPKGL